MTSDIGNPFQIFQTLQEEALKIFEMAIQTTCQKLDEIADEAKARMENLIKDFANARQNLEKQIAIIHEHSLKMIADLVSETEKYIMNVWDNTRKKILILVDTIVSLVDTDKINQKLGELTSFMSMKVGEFNQRVKEHADGIIDMQTQFFQHLTQKLQSSSS